MLHICRACLVKQDKEDVPETIISEVTKMFSFCTSIEISESDGLPFSFCLQCLDHIQNCYNFIKMCKSTDEILRSYQLQKKDFVDILPSDKVSVVKTENASIQIKDEESKSVKNENQITVYFDDGFDVNTTDDHSDNMIEQCNSESNKVKKKKRTEKSQKLKKITSKKEYTCEVCCKVVEGKTSFLQHMRRHKNYKKYICDHCKKEFKQSDALVAHLRKHNNDQPFSCNICKQQFKYKVHLISHKKVHVKVHPYKCEKCDKSFHIKCRLDAHDEWHKKNKTMMVCYICGIQAYNLTVHMRVHTGEKPFKCPKCSFQCSNYSSMRRHKIKHANLKPYPCTYCGKGFNNRSSLVRHIMIHTGELPYKCDFCPRAFIDNSKRKIHMMKTHNIPWESMIPLKPGEYKNKTISAPEVKQKIVPKLPKYK